MSTDTATTPVPDAPAEDAHDEHAHHGPTDKLLIYTALFLAAVTAVEVAWSYLPWPDDGIGVAFEVIGLMLMMALKFGLIANVFMHLKWENKLLTWVFAFGLALAVVVYMIVLFVFEFWSTSEPPYTG